MSHSDIEAIVQNILDIANALDIKSFDVIPPFDERLHEQAQNLRAKALELIGLELVKNAEQFDHYRQALNNKYETLENDIEDLKDINKIVQEIANIFGILDNIINIFE